MATATTPISSAALSGELARPARIQSVDLLRGIVMAIMALDHVRDFFTHLRFQPEDLANTFAGLFFTRWITHFCAPAFFFLAGTGAYFYGRTRTKAQVCRFLWTRGLVLMLMEFTIMWWGWTFFLSPIGPAMIVIWALGLSMAILSFLIRLPLKAVAAISLLVIATHNLFDKIAPAMLGKLSWLWLILHQQGFYVIAPPSGPNQPPLGFFVAYPVVPWFAVMGAGYALGAVYAKPVEERKRILMRLGIAVTVLFFVLRGAGLYGNMAPPTAQAGFIITDAAGPFVVQDTIEKTVIKFFNVYKYPPSLQFLLMTLGPSLIFLSLADQFSFKGLLGKIAHPFHVIGKVPMFYYICHLYLIHALAIVTAIAFSQPWRWMWRGSPIFGPKPDGYGHNLPFIWLMWILVVAILYFPCRWYAKYKATHKHWWLSYI
jgi:uncharacterized membrane protein